MPLRRSAFVGPCVSSRSATSAAAAPRGTTRSTRTTQPFRTNATSTVFGRRLRRVRRRCGTATARARARRRLEVDREQAREREHEDDEQDAHRAVPVRRAPGNACKRALPLSSRHADADAARAESRHARAPAPAAAAPTSVTQALERTAGLQAQWPPSPVPRPLVARGRLRPDDLVRAVARRHVVKATLMRTTLHLVSCSGLPRVWRDLPREPDPRPRAAARGARRGRRLRGGGRAPRSPRRRARHGRGPSCSRCSAAEAANRGSSPWLLWYGLSAHAGLVNGPESSVWRSHTAGGTFVPARTWLGADAASGDAAAAHLVSRYLAAFGPASRADIAQWTGMARSVVDQGLAGLELRRFRDEQERELFDLPRAPLPSAETPAPARLLPRFDNLVLSHDDRRRVLADEYRAAVIERGEVRATFLVDGFVAGTWALEGGRVETPAVRAASESRPPRGRRRGSSARGVRARVRPRLVTNWLTPCRASDRARLHASRARCGRDDRCRGGVGNHGVRHRAGVRRERSASSRMRSAASTEPGSSRRAA